MVSLNAQSVRPAHIFREAVVAPAWVCAMMQDASAASDGADCIVSHTPDAALVSARVPGAARLTATAMRAATTACYDRIASALSRLDARHPVRFWNNIPGIHDDMGDGQDRYMVFNAGRFDAFAKWYGSPATFDQRVATASGVGHDGDDLVIHCLASSASGRAIDNPRQIPPYRYSRKYGARPPCFARATITTEPRPVLLVGGMASIVGEDSSHLNELAEQTEETLTNLAAVVNAAAGLHQDADPPAALARFTELRVYIPNQQHVERLALLLPSRFPNVRQIELVRAALCRSELLVEIEGVADLGAAN